MDNLVLARAIHLVAVLFWIGGVGFVTWVVMPALRASEAPADRLTRFHQIESRFAWQVHIWVLLAGLAMMTFPSLLPQGILQTYVSIEHGYAFARSPEFIHSPIVQALVWARVPGDLFFSVGVFTFAWFIFRAFRLGRRQNQP